jgi:Kef-type K+ transport system membrane component KefB
MPEGLIVDPSSFLLNLAIILIFTKIGGIICKRWGIPAVLGQVLMGVLLGPTVLGLVKSDLLLDEIGQLGVIFLMFLAGLDTEMESMKRLGKKALLVAVGGALLPFIGGTIVALVFNYNLHTAIFVGTILTATSISITVQTLLELGKLKTPEGNVILAAAVIDDIIGIILLAIVVSFGNGSSTNILLLMGRIILFFILIYLVGQWVFPLLVGLHAKHNIREGRVTLAIAICLLFAWLADNMGLATIIGAYLMGIFVGQTNIKNLVTQRVQIIAYTFFIPIFFVGIGTGVNLRQIDLSVLLFALAITVTAILTKMVGSMCGALLGKFDLKSSLRIGVGMIARGEVGLVVTSLGVRMGIIGNEVFSAVLILIIVAIIITPVLLPMVFKEPEEQVVKPGIPG